MSEQQKRCYCCGAVLEGGHTLFCPACWDHFRPLDNLPRCRVCRRILIGFDDDICPPCKAKQAELAEMHAKTATTLTEKEDKACTACTASAETKSC